MSDLKPPFVRLENVSYTHWNQTEPTLRGVSLAIQHGTLNVLVGPGGSGKSTLCSLFNGEIPHLLGGKMEGTVWLDGRDTRELEAKDLSRRVGHVLQDPENMFATLYVDDEIAFGPENLRKDVEEIRAGVDRLLADVNMAPFRHNLVWNLSGGQIQKLGLACILAMCPEMIVLDEPTANLDPQATRSVHELILKLRGEGITVLLVTRELDDFLLSAADQLLVLDSGRMRVSGAPQDVLLQHGPELDALGIWLPETVEIGIALRERFRRPLATVPVTVEETLDALHSAGLGSRLSAGERLRADQSGGETLVSARDLTYTYAGGYHALKGVSFDICRGEMLAIIGRNGAGKSTLAKLLVGLLKPQTGSLSMFGKPAKQWKVADLATHLALVFQNPEHQFLTDTVYDEIAYSLMARGIEDPVEIRRHVNETLALLQLEPVEKLHPFSLSAGMKRRLGVATMLVSRPEILVVDEPTYGQDRQMTHTLMALMESIRAQGVTVVMITHDMRLVEEYAGRVMVMSEGQVLYNGDPAGLFASEEMLRSASLRPTLLQDLLDAYQRSGGQVCCPVRNTEDFLQALEHSLNTEAQHG